MGYTHYVTRPSEIKKSAWSEIVKDTRTVFEYIENELGIVLADGHGENRPIITDESISFNGSEKQPLGIWTTSEEVSIPWPAPHASLNEPSADPIGEKTAGEWYAGTLLKQRVAPVRDSPYGSGSYESSGLDRKSEYGRELCKTAYRPYDIAVTAFYTIVKHHVPECTVKSDGVEEDWMDAMIICHNLLGYPLVSPLG